MQHFMVHNATMKLSRPSKRCCQNWTVLLTCKCEVSSKQPMLSRCSTFSSELRKQYVSPSEAEHAIRKVIDVQLDIAPLRLLNATTGLLCDLRSADKTSKRSPSKKQLRHTFVVSLSHRWEGKEPLLHDIKDKVVYELQAAGQAVS
ncbi:uncharacterized protein EDB91DRAFT_1120571 [Suillus paluster]|uniref:uncharacterized protein n=1 Tax=Suillus paluster TaxID=48578 RepID=UPI001B88118F|nr:uncharacterized protein EDB91DRAFT_1120571 [Suillus paluster]KAG1745385.1 hypothetical protein EDB91DRAFT_1120571 [Suillus paluster]